MNVIPNKGSHKGIFPQWMRGFLLIAAIYNFAWGLFIAVFPEIYYEWMKGEEIIMSPFMQYQGLGILIFGILYLLAAINPIRFRFFILAGLISKIVGVLLLYYPIMGGVITDKAWFHLIMHDLVWTIPLGIIFVRAAMLHHTRHGLK